MEKEAVMRGYNERSGVEGEVDRAIVPPLPGFPINGPPRPSILGNKPLVNASPLQIVIANY